MASNQKIFVVEDHPTTARALKMFLETQGYEVSLAEDVASAVNFAKDNTFDLLICDLNLPDGSGWDLMKRLRSARPVRGIAFSASGSDDDIARSKEAGFIDHVVKGCSADELAATIRKSLMQQAQRKTSRTQRSSSQSRNGAE
jgi:DNA-binding response OmpR family regulator